MPDKKRTTPFANFEKAVKKVLGTTKRESDEQMTRLKAQNKARREGRKKN